MYHVTWEEVDKQAQAIATYWRDKGIATVYGVPQGGAPLAVMVANYLGVRVVEEPKLGLSTLVVDDLVDSGRTLQDLHKSFATDAAFCKPHSPKVYAPSAVCIDDWLAFPWERNHGKPTDGIVRLLEYIGEDPSRDGLVDTPERVVRALVEMTQGYKADVGAILSTSFDVPYDEMVVLRNVPYSSMCEHHMLPFTGHVTLGYIPSNRVVGLSKLARLVDAYAQRLQVQERLTTQLTDALQEHLNPIGCGAVVRGNHSCMCNRGIRKSGEMVTSSLVGVFRNDSTARAEFMALAKP